VYKNDQRSGCRYDGIDSPIFSGAVGDRVEIALEFRGVIIDVAAGDEVLVEKTWKIVCSAVSRGIHAHYGDALLASECRPGRAKRHRERYRSDPAYRARAVARVHRNQQLERHRRKRRASAAEPRPNAEHILRYLAGVVDSRSSLVPKLAGAMLGLWARRVAV